MALNRTTRYALIALAVLVMIPLASFAGLLSIPAVTGVDTQTKRFNTVFAGRWEGYGTWANSELLDAPSYVSGFNGDGHSDKFVAAGEFARQDFYCSRFAAGLYRFWFKPASGTYPPEHIVPETSIDLDQTRKSDIPSHNGFVLIKEDSKTLSAGQGCPDRMTVPSSLMTTTGNFYGELLVELYGRFLDVLYDKWILMTLDRAAINPGWGTVGVENADGLVEVGEDLRIRYDVGAACAESVNPAEDNPCGWTLQVRSVDTGAIPEGWSDKTLGDFVSGTVSVTVKASWFQLNTRNQYQVRLFNQVNLQDTQQFVTVDDRTLTPSETEVTVTPGPPYHQGDQITLGLKSVPNGQTGIPIRDFDVYVRQGDRILVDHQKVPAASDGTGSTSFSIADESIDVHIEVFAFDGSRSSGVSEKTMVVADTDQDNNPPPGSQQTPFPLLQVLLLVAGIVAILIAVFLPLPGLVWRIVLILIGLALVAIGVLSLLGVL